MTALPEGVGTVAFDSLTPTEPFLFGSVSGDEYGLSDISVSRVYREFGIVGDCWLGSGTTSF